MCDSENGWKGGASITRQLFDVNKSFFSEIQQEMGDFSEILILLVNTKNTQQVK